VIVIDLERLISRLKQPSVLLSLVSQGISIFILMGFNLNEDLIKSLAAIICSILVTLGILSNPDTKNRGYGDDILFCICDGKNAQHVRVNGHMICQKCGNIHPDAN